MKRKVKIESLSDAENQINDLLNRVDELEKFIMILRNEIQKGNKQIHSTIYDINRSITNVNRKKS